MDNQTTTTTADLQARGFWETIAIVWGALFSIITRSTLFTLGIFDIAESGQRSVLNVALTAEGHTIDYREEEAEKRHLKSIGREERIALARKNAALQAKQDLKSSTK